MSTAHILWSECLLQHANETSTHNKEATLNGQTTKHRNIRHVQWRPYNNVKTTRTSHRQIGSEYWANVESNSCTFLFLCSTPTRYTHRVISTANHTIPCLQFTNYLPQLLGQTYCRLEMATATYTDTYMTCSGTSQMSYKRNFKMMMTSIN